MKEVINPALFPQTLEVEHCEAQSLLGWEQNWGVDSEYE